MEQASLPAKAVQCVIFRVGGTRQALPIDVVREILVPGPITPAPGAPASVLGLAQVRGRAIPVVDLAVRLGLPAVAPTAERRLVVVNASYGASALLVDTVDEVATIQPGEFEIVPVPGLGERIVIKRSDALIGWLPSADDVVDAGAAPVLEDAA